MQLAWTPLPYSNPLVISRNAILSADIHGVADTSGHGFAET